MSLFSWVQHVRARASKSSTFSSHIEERRLKLAAEQRQLAVRLETVLQRTQKQLFAMVERIRYFNGVQAEERTLMLEQAALQRWLERSELVQTDTSELLREWRDWMRAMRQGVVTDQERAELVRSELRVRGVITDEHVSFSVTQSRPTEETARPCLQDLFGEWDQYMGEHLEGSAVFWRERVEELQRKEANDLIVCGYVKRMREAQGHAKAWRRMQG